VVIGGRARKGTYISRENATAAGDQYQCIGKGKTKPEAKTKRVTGIDVASKIPVGYGRLLGRRPRDEPEG